MKTLFLCIALWNTIVAAINVLVLPRFLPPEAFAYMTPASQFLPIFIPLIISFYCGRSQSGLLGKVRQWFVASRISYESER